VAAVKPRILVVDDHPDSRDIITLAMERWGYEAFEARDGREAMAQIESVDFNLVIIDIAMPFVSGRDVGRSIKSNPRTNHIPVLAVTALDSSEHRKMCLQAGFDDFLSKPFALVSLKSKVETLLGRASRQ
jgi:two-component system cell cycle response regulator